MKGVATLETVTQHAYLLSNGRKMREPTWRPLTPSCEEVGFCPPPSLVNGDFFSGRFACRHARHLLAAPLPGTL